MGKQSILQQRGVVIDPTPARGYRIVTFDDCTPPVYGAMVVVMGRDQGLAESLSGEPVQSASAALVRQYLAQKGFAEIVPIADVLAE